MHFGTKNYLKSTHNHTAKHALNFIVKTNYKRGERRQETRRS